MPASWQFPPGVNSGLWDYVRDADVARSYDGYLADSPLAQIDLAFCERHFARPGKLLDLGCGTGRMLLAFARRGWWSVGVDLSEEMLRVVGEKARRDNELAASSRVALLKANFVDLA